ncbi:MAG: right-handed parallel beta-helix repeat-containing protein [Brevundimonas sp.]|uniref:right-handed parallel beta-helix repeat-containing protein n=1 Tax=Brevundimonas sp. TaxID=1871086 RepID=UPI00391C63BA
MDFSSLQLPTSVTAVYSSGYDRPGVGAALYRQDSDQSTTMANRRRRRISDGRWFVLSESEVNVTMTGARGDGRHDDTAAIQEALDAALTVIVPGADRHYRITAPLVLRAGQIVRGEGDRSRIIQSAGGASAAALWGDRLQDLTVADLHVTPGPAGPNFLHGHAILLRDCTGIRIERLTVSGHRRGGVTLQNCSTAVVRSCGVGASSVNPVADDHTATGYDILVVNGGSDILIADNRCVNGAGTGIGVQSTATSEPFTFHNIRIENNVVDEQGCYGILVYRSNLDKFENIRVTGNTVSNISGSVRQSTYGRVFGAGIYIQGVDGTVVAGNSVRRTNLTTEIEMLAPAGIGVANATDVRIEDNLVEDCGWYGVCVFDPNGEGSTDGVSRIVGNVIRNNAKTGICTKDIRAATVTRNTVTDNGEHGFLSRSHSPRTAAARHDLRDNRFADNAGQGIFFLGGDGDLLNNDISHNDGGGVVLGSAGRFQLVGNRIANNGAWGVSGVPAAKTTMRDNRFDDNRTGDVSLPGTPLS